MVVFLREKKLTTSTGNNRKGTIMTETKPATPGPETTEPLDVTQMIEDAAHDPCMPIRNLGGHLITCNYGDWLTFDKCDCANGLAGTPDTPPTHVNVAPMPLRDWIASTINISDEAAHDMATGIKMAELKQRRIETVSAILGVDDPEAQGITVVDIAKARAKLRYLEADAMLHWRLVSLQQQRDAAELLRLVCVCGHGPDQHDTDQASAQDHGGSEPCRECTCEQYTRPNHG